MSNARIHQKQAHTLSKLIDYYEVCNRAEGKSPRAIAWYSANLRRFRSYPKSRHLSDSVGGVTTQLLGEYVLHLVKQDRFADHPNTPKQEGR